PRCELRLHPRIPFSSSLPRIYRRTKAAMRPGLAWRSRFPRRANRLTPQESKQCTRHIAAWRKSLNWMEESRKLVRYYRYSLPGRRLTTVRRRDLPWSVNFPVGWAYRGKGVTRKPGSFRCPCELGENG